MSKAAAFNLGDIANPAVARVFSDYPPVLREKLLSLRRLVLDTAAETEGVGAVQETLKWGEPSYLVEGGSTIRMGWKPSVPTQYALYFHCKTLLVDTFRELYHDTLRFDGNRAIVFDAQDEIPIDAVMHCVALSLTYHRKKHLPMLGA